MPFSWENVGGTMAQTLSLPSSARSKSSEKSSPFFLAIGSAGIEGSFDASAAKAEAGTKRSGASRWKFIVMKEQKRGPRMRE